MRLIDADAIIKALNSNCKPELCHDYKTAWCVACCPHNDFVDLLEDAPTVEQRPQGKWFSFNDRLYSGGGYTVCSNCEMRLSFGAYHEVFDFKYCPECGADMRGEDHV